PTDVEWVRGGIEELGRKEKINLALPPDVKIVEAPANRTLSELLAEGEIDALIGPRMPSSFHSDPRVGWLFEDPTAEAEDYFRRTRIFPIMHMVGIRRELVKTHPWLPASVQKAFERSKAVCLDRLLDTSATKVTLPFVEEQLQRARALIGRDFWSYGVDDATIHVIDTFLD